MTNALRRWTAMAVLGAVAMGAQTAEADEQETSRVQDLQQVEAAEEADDVVWSFEASIRPRLEGRFNHHFGLDEEQLNYGFQPDEADQFSQQSRLRAQVRRDGLSGHLTLQHAEIWGEFGGDELTAPPLSVFEARLRYHEYDWFFVDAGRFELAYGDQRVLGAVGWSQVGRAWDGVRVGLEPIDELNVDGFAVRYDDGSGDFLRGDSFLLGAYATVVEPIEDVVETADVYLLYDLSEFGQEPVDSRITFGSRLAATLGDVDATAEGAFQFSPRCPTVHDHRCSDALEVRAYFADLDVGYTLSEIRSFVGTSIASGNDPETERIEAYDQLYPTGHAWLGYTDIIGPRSNLVELRGGVQGRYRWLNYELAAHHFRRLQSDVESVGLELNAKLFADVVDGLEAGVGHGLFVPDGGISATDDAPRGVANWSFAQMAGTF